MSKANRNLFALILLTLVLAIKTINYSLTPLYNSDKLVRLIAAQNWAEGNGISRASWFSQEPLQIKYEPIHHWPPGYSVFVGLLLKTGFTIFTASILPDLLSLFFLSLYTLLFLSGFTFHWNFSGILIGSILLINSAIAAHLSSVDLIAYTCFFGALSLLIISVKKTFLISGILAGILLGMTIWFESIYMPQVLALLLFGIYHQWRFNPGTLKKVWIPCAAIFLFSVLLYFLYSGIGAQGYTDVNTSGLSWNNIQKTHWSFAADGILGMEGITHLLREQSPILYWILLIILVGLISMVTITIIRRKPRSRFPWPLLLSIIPINIFLLFYFSIIGTSQTGVSEGWAFVQESKYYAPSWAAICMTLVWYLSYQKSKVLEQLILTPIFLFVFADASFYQQWRLGKIHTLSAPNSNQIPDFNDFVRIAEMAKKNNQIPVQNPNDSYTSLIAELAGWTPILNWNNIGNETCLLQHEVPLPESTENQKIGLEIHLASGKKIYLTNPPHLWN